jgi:hypothetical protein|tara:strand:- start:251 stop:1087 length:837 start_codon:yes stop_codon:yes gene_type:complete
MLDRIEKIIDKRGFRGRLRKTFLYNIYRVLKSLPMIFDKRMYYLYSRKIFKDALDMKFTNGVSIWLNSFFDKPENTFHDLKNKNKYPWICFEAINYLTFFLQQRKDPVCFEWGSGASTLYLSDYVKNIRSIENDENFYNEINNEIYTSKIKNVEYYLVKETSNNNFISTDHNLEKKYSSQDNDYKNKNFYEYVNIIKNFKDKYDVIFIDGQCRNACFENALEYIKDDGLIVFDNTSREIYKNKLKNLDKKYKIIFLSGPTPYAQTIDETAFIFKVKNN